MADTSSKTTITISGASGGSQSISYAASITIDFALGADVVVGTLTGDLTMNAPTNPAAGHLTVYLTQDATGGRVVTWNSAFILSGQLPTTPGLTTAVEFGWNGTKWVQIGIYSTPAVADSTVPTAPTVTATPGDAQVVLTWTGATDNVAVTSYEVYRNNVLVGSPTAASFTDTLLTNGTSYNYTVKAVDAAGNKSVASATVSATPTGVVAGANRRPFSISQSPFNKKLVDKFPSGIPIATLSDTYIASVENRSGQPPYMWWGCDTSQYTVAVYVVESSWLTGTPTEIEYSGIHCEASESSVTQQTGGTGSPYAFPMRLPSTLKPAIGSDAQFVIWDRDNLLQHASGPQHWDIWQIDYNVGTGYWEPDVNGRLVCTNFTHAIGELASDGAFTAGPVAYASRGPGFPYMAGLVRKWEIDAGVIEHAIACAWHEPATSFVFPASKSDGTQSLTTDMPEGAFFKLKDSFPVSDLQDPVARMFATAAQQYGLVAADWSGTSKVYWEADESAGGGAYWPSLATPAFSAGVADNFLREIPINEFICVDPNGTSSLREPDMRIDTSKGDDPIGTQTAVLDTVQANATSSSAAATGAAMSTDELVVIAVSMKSNNAYVTGVTGTNGLNGTWKRLGRIVEKLPIGTNLITELWWTRSTSGTAGVATAALSASVAWEATLIRHTVGSAIRKKFGKYLSSAAPIVRLRSTTSLSLVVCIGLCRGNQTMTKEAAATLLGTANHGGGGNANLPAVTAMTLPGGGDITVSPTMGGTAEVVLFAYEVT